MASASSVQVVTVVEPLIQYSSELFPEAVSFEIPDVLEVPEEVLPAPTLIHEKEKLSRAFSTASSTASSCSSYHTSLSKTNSTASQDSMGFFLIKSGSISRTGTSTWGAPSPETTAPPLQQTTAPIPTPPITPVHPSPVPTSSASVTTSATSNQIPAPPPRSMATNSVNKSPTQKQSSEQLEPILEAPPGSPKASLKITSAYKPKRSFVYKSQQPGEQVVAQFSKPKAPPPPRIQAPSPPTSSTPNSTVEAPSLDTRTHPIPPPRSHTLKKPPPNKKPGLKAPTCPPPLPPPSIAQ